jgi:hypothetical protein
LADPSVRQRFADFDFEIRRREQQTSTAFHKTEIETANIITGSTPASWGRRSYNPFYASGASGDCEGWQLTGSF